MEVCSVASRFSRVIPSDMRFIDTTYENNYDMGEGDVDLEGCQHQEELDDIILEVQPRTPQEMEAMREFVAATKRSKFLFDGENLIKIQPKKVSVLKAILGKAYLMRKRMQNKKKKKAEVEVQEEMEECQSDPSVFSGQLSDYTQRTFVVPILVDRITQMLDMRENTTGVYAKGANMEEVRRLKEQFKRGDNPTLNGVNEHVLANTVISFLEDLDDRLVPSAMRESFIAAGQIEDMRERVGQLRELVSQLPKINRMTLGSMIGNAQALANRCMTLAVYARVFGPLMIGYSCPAMEQDPQELAEMSNTMYGLMQIEYNFYNSAKDCVFEAQPKKRRKSWFK